MTTSASINPISRATTPARYMMRLSTLSRLAVLAAEPRGDQGFGYDPIFIPEGHDRTFGELSAEVKHTFSHRARACAALRARLRTGAEG